MVFTNVMLHKDAVIIYEVLTGGYDKHQQQKEIYERKAQI